MRNSGTGKATSTTKKDMKMLADMKGSGIMRVLIALARANSVYNC